MWHWHDGFGGWGVFWMVLFMAIFWVPLLLLLLWGLRELVRPRGGPPGAAGPGAGPPPGEPDARELARRAYARGDIDRERYLQIMRDLEEPGR